MFEIRLIVPVAPVLSASCNPAECWNLATTSQPFTPIGSGVPNFSTTLPTTGDQEGRQVVGSFFAMRRCQAVTQGSVVVSDTRNPE
jgi:hypothetical protein